MFGLGILSTSLLLSEVNAQEDDASLAADARSHVGERISSFELQDFRGKTHLVKTDGEAKGTLIVVLGVECPLAKLYTPVLNRIADSYSAKGISCIAINSNSQDSITDMAAYSSRFEMTMPYLKDVGNEISNRLGATRTPEAFLLSSDGTICYQGRIDNQYGIGSVREADVTSFLTNAMDDLLAGSDVRHPFEPTIGCLIGRVREPVLDSEITYANQVSRILQNRCVECHRQGEIAPFALVDYDEVSGWADMIAEVVDEQRMPPWHASPEHGEFSNARALSEDEKQTLIQWARNGAPMGDESMLPEPMDYVTGWQLPSKPDVIIPISKEPFRVKAEGEVEYKYFEVDPGFTEDKWVKAAELLPGNRSVVHHILVFIREPGQSADVSAGGLGGFLFGYVPGFRVDPYLEGMAKRIPAGSTLVFQMHYTPVGTVQEDISKLGLIFAEPEEVKYEVVTTSAVQLGIEILPNQKDQKEYAYSHMNLKDYQLLSFMPHMHLRGQSFKYELVKADQTRETILDVPHYDFNWQSPYQLAKPIRFSKGDRIACTATYDNSPENPHFNDSDRLVRWGDQTSDEMMIGYFDVAVPIEEATAMKKERERLFQDEVEMMSHLFLTSNDANGDEFLSVEELRPRMRRAVGRFDTDGDKKLSLEEIRTYYKQRR